MHYFLFVMFIKFYAEDHAVDHFIHLDGSVARCMEMNDCRLTGLLVMEYFNADNKNPGRKRNALLIISLLNA